MGVLRSNRRTIQAERWRHDLIQSEPLSYAARMLLTSPIAYWPLTDTDGLITRCLVNSAQNGLYTSFVILADATSPAGLPCPRFVRQTDVLTAALASAFNSDELTIAIWAKLYDAAHWTDGLWNAPTDFAVDGNNYVWDWALSSTNNQLSIRYRAGGVSDNITDLSYGGTMTWMHFATTVSKTADQLKGFVNGSQVGATQSTLGNWVGNLTRAQIGKWSAGNFFKGWLADCILWDRALTPDEISAVATV